MLSLPCNSKQLGIKMTPLFHCNFLTVIKLLFPTILGSQIFVGICGLPSVLSFREVKLLFVCFVLKRSSQKSKTFSLHKETVALLNKIYQMDLFCLICVYSSMGLFHRAIGKN